MKGKVTEILGNPEKVQAAIDEAMNDLEQSKSQQEADEYINGLLKDPKMRADMERAERDAASQPVSWEMAAEGIDDIPQPAPSKEIER